MYVNETCQWTQKGLKKKNIYKYPEAIHAGEATASTRFLMSALYRKTGYTV